MFVPCNSRDAVQPAESTTPASPVSATMAHPHCSEGRPRSFSQESIEHLFVNNKKWREDMNERDPTFFERSAVGQKPRYLWIGCSDSRVPAEEITGLDPGDAFVHRNVANLVVSNDISALSVVQFAVENLKVRDIIVCGHYGCGGVKAAMKNKQNGLLDNWLRNIRDVCRLHKAELMALPTEEERYRRLVELNIQEQCLNIFKINMVQRRQGRYGHPRIHGLVYDIKTGALTELDVDYRGYIAKHMGVYRLHTFPDGELPTNKSQLRRNMILDLAQDHEEEPGMVSIRYMTRMLKKEPELFTAEEVVAGMAALKLKFEDPTSPFVFVDSLIAHFAPGAVKSTK